MNQNDRFEENRFDILYCIKYGNFKLLDESLQKECNDLYYHKVNGHSPDEFTRRWDILKVKLKFRYDGEYWRIYDTNTCWIVKEDKNIENFTLC